MPGLQPVRFRTSGVFPKKSQHFYRLKHSVFFGVLGLERSVTFLMYRNFIMPPPAPERRRSRRRHRRIRDEEEAEDEVGDEEEEEEP